MRMRVTSFLFVGIALASAEASAQTRVACVGDSITEGDGASAPNKAYPAVLQQLLGTGYAVQNDGHSGATLLKAGDLPYWSTSEYSAAGSWTSAGGDVVIQLGTNDSKPGNWAKKAAFEADCEALVAHYQRPKTRVWVNLIPPATASACCSIDGTVIKNEIVPLLKQCAAARGVPTIDVHAALAPHTSWLPDGVHPNDSGAALIARTVRAAISKQPAIKLTAKATRTVAPGTVKLTATPSAAYGRVERVSFHDGPTLLEELTAAPWTTELTNVAAGVHVYTARVVETAGRTKTSTAVTIEIDGAVVESPDAGGVDPDDAGPLPPSDGEVVASPTRPAPSAPTEEPVEGGAPSSNDEGCRAGRVGPTDPSTFLSALFALAYAVSRRRA